MTGFDHEILNKGSDQFLSEALFNQKESNFQIDRRVA